MLRGPLHSNSLFYVKIIATHKESDNVKFHKMTAYTIIKCSEFHICFHNSCRLLFARQLIPRKCCLCSQGKDSGSTSGNSSILDSRSKNLRDSEIRNPLHGKNKLFQRESLPKTGRLRFEGKNQFPLNFAHEFILVLK